MRVNALLLAAACSLVIAGCSQAKDAQKPPGGTEVDKAFGEQVRAYLLQHPEVIKEAIDRYNANQEAEAAEASKAAIGKNRQALERDPRDFVANPNGKITVVEFYDYRCPHCVNVAPKVLDFIAKNPDVRVVLKELPIFGAESERAALAALAVKRAGGDYLGAHKAMMAARPLDDAAIARVLAANGLTLAAVNDPSDENRKHLKDVHDLAGEIGVSGTPSFIIGDVLVPGEDMDAVQAAVNTARKAS